MAERKAFTLTEVLIVVLIIGIMAAMAIPQFNKSMENAREREARTTLIAIYNAEKMYKIDKDVYTNDFSSLSSYIENPNDTADYYVFDIADDPNIFSATATRMGGDGRVLTIDNTGEITP